MNEITNTEIESFVNPDGETVVYLTNEQIRSGLKELLTLRKENAELKERMEAIE